MIQLDLNEGGAAAPRQDKIGPEYDVGMRASCGFGYEMLAVDLQDIRRHHRRPADGGGGAICPIGADKVSGSFRICHA